MRIRVLGLVAALALAAVACEDSQSGQSVVPSDGGLSPLVAAGPKILDAGVHPHAKIPLLGGKFTPGPTTIKVGEAISIINLEDGARTIASGSPDSPDGQFGTTLAPGESVDLAFPVPGVYTLYAVEDPGAIASITVAP
jgi:plastocyanin